MARRRKKDKGSGLAESIVGLLALVFFVYLVSAEFRAIAHLVLFFLVCIGLIYLGFRVFWKKEDEGSSPVENDYSNPGIQGDFQRDENAELTATKLREIDWFQFEKLVALIYRSRGYEVQHYGGANPDGGVDLLVDSADGLFIVQCKHWKSKNVTVKELRELVGTLVDEKVTHGVFVTMHGFTEPAKEYADRNKIILCDAQCLLELIHSSPGAERAQMLELLYDDRKICPKCGKQMVLRTNQKDHSEFFGCNGFPKCRYTMEK